MKRDKQTKSAGFQTRKDHINYFWQLFDLVPKSTVARQLGIHFARINKMVDNVKEIKYKDLLLLSDYFRVDPEFMFRLVRTQHITGSKPELRRSGRKKKTAEKKHAKQDAKLRAKKRVKRRAAKRAQKKKVRRKK